MRKSDRHITTVNIVKKRMFTQKHWLNVGCVRTAAGIWRMCRAFASRAFPHLPFFKPISSKKIQFAACNASGRSPRGRKVTKILKLTILFNVSHFLL